MPSVASSNPTLTAGCVCMLLTPLWCDMGCCSRTVVVLKLRQTSALKANVRNSGIAVASKLCCIAPGHRNDPKLQAVAGVKPSRFWPNEQPALLARFVPLARCARCEDGRLRGGRHGECGAPLLRWGGEGVFEFGWRERAAHSPACNPSPAAPQSQPSSRL